MIPLLGTTQVTVTRRAPGQRATSGPSRGEFIEGAESTIAIVASVQPLGGRELEVMPEGLRRRARFKAYTEAELQTAEQDGATQADRVTWRGVQYEVTAEVPYPDAHALRHRKYILSKPVESP